MAKLTEKQRANVPARECGLPDKARSDAANKQTGNDPVPDRGHAISAKRLSRKQRHAGNLTEDNFERIDRKPHKVLAADRCRTASAQRCKRLHLEGRSAVALYCDHATLNDASNASRVFGTHSQTRLTSRGRCRVRVAVGQMYACSKRRRRDERTDRTDTSEC